MLRIGILGMGNISGVHVSGWLAVPDASITAICDILPAQMAKYDGTLTAKRYTDARKMLDREQLDILDICLPTYLHTEYTILALKHGVHVLCEKPVSLRAEDADTVCALARDCGLTYMTAQVLRFMPGYAALKEICDTKRFGSLLSGQMHRLGSYPQWSPDNWFLKEELSGLVPFDLHIHDVDFLVYAFGAPKHVVSHRSRRPEQDYLSVVYEYDGFFVTAEAAWYAAPYPFRFGYRFQFERALVTGDSDTLTVYEKDGGTYRITPERTEEGPCSILFSRDGYQNEIRYFAECVRAGRPAELVRPEELKTVVGLLNAPSR